jgi:carboxyl-terminal processing protease
MAGPMIILVSRFSASASEIFAGALKNHRRALIVGDPHTHGKGSVQALIEMDRLSLLPRKTPYLGSVKITIQKWYLPDGSSTQQKGVAADIPLPSFNETLPLGESDMPNALPWDSIPTIPWTPLGYEKKYKFHRKRSNSQLQKKNLEHQQKT